MSPNTPNTARSIRRRPSLLSSFRPRTAGADIPVPPLPSRPHTGVWIPHKDGSYRELMALFSHETGAYDLGSVQQQQQQPQPEPQQQQQQQQPQHQSKQQIQRHPESLEQPDLLDPEDANAYPHIKTRHRPSKSFSSLRHGVYELRAVARRLSLTVRNKSSRYNLSRTMEGNDDGNVSDDYKSADSGAAMGCWDASRATHRPSLGSLNALGRYCTPPSSVPCVTDPIPGSGSEPPILPDDLSRGAAARAAAAAQNEMIKVCRMGSRGDSKIFDSDTALIEEADVAGEDSESGIDVDLQDHVDVSEVDDLEVVRKDPMDYLPAELMAHILSFLDADSLSQAELVSHSWHDQAVSHHVWREVFRREYRGRPQTGKMTNGQSKSMGLGRSLPNQDWKKMFAVRRMLEARWKEGKAAAIYLHGHKDSVYCVQFDENKIITGSRDRTIRVWDAHYPWPCLKIIGAPPDPKSPLTLGPLVIDPPEDSIARTPFISICPPARSSPDLVIPTSDTSDYHRASILCLQFDDEILVTGSSDYTCIVWDIKDDYKALRRLVGHQAGVLDVCFDDKYIISCSKDTTICVWDRKTGELVKRLLGHRGPVNAVQLRGDLIVSASGDGVAKLWNITSGLCIREFPSRDRGLACVEFSEDARTILAGGNDQVIYQFDANTGELVNELKGHTGLVRSLHMDSSNGRIVSGSYDMSVKVFDSKSGEMRIDLPGWTTSWMLSAKSDYRRIVATSQDSRTVIMDFGYGIDGIELLEE
ncbi:F-box/WD repeat-containing protein 1A [Paracoccidioides lutzii Pb01]|uniref:Probable E3 ubiquitin ligase complex SCF subunit sconB n=1 Tax=Paracoccidioides lutzii (strain ATCC MYA-826 / Pb01) TaxID=502779 RepID=C1H8U9_PARBA|nr:F-box/WD repeat-containing protein 1A [Paracoccidioides lutzii Pb01]EEH36772.1 F-box/WD repeat-containing protein 1A [Paracoccidioides lutzii Pb01]